MLLLAMIIKILENEWRFLTFRKPSRHIREHPGAYLAFGFAVTWLVGVGRYWDNPRAEVWQYLGLGSIAYVFILALIIWGMMMPLRPKNWSYRNVLLFVTLTAPPAVLYAIPVERFMTMEEAVVANMWFLAVVALWRVALYFRFLLRTTDLNVYSVIIGTLAPILVIIVLLAMLNLEHVAFRFMSGIPPEEQTANDAAYMIVVGLSWLSFLLLPVVAVGYGVLVNRAWRHKREGIED